MVRDNITKEMIHYSEEKFADLQLLRYELKGFDGLSARQKALVYYLSEATLSGRDITFDQFGKYNLRIRKMLEAVYLYYREKHQDESFRALEIYLKRIWFSNGIYHHYSCDKIKPEFEASYLGELIDNMPSDALPLQENETREAWKAEIFPVIFDATVLPKRVNKDAGEDLITTSACNFYEGVTQQEVEEFYSMMKQKADKEPPSYGLNSKLVKRNGQIEEEKWTATGRYATAIHQIVSWLEKAEAVAENEQQAEVIRLLISYYRSGDLKTFDKYSIAWVKEQSGDIDFVNGFIEVYGDPLGLKGSWEGIVEYKDKEATLRTQTISRNAQWFEDHSPIDNRFKKKIVKGVSAHAVCAAMLGGDEYPSTAIGINLPNADWIRAEYGSKSVTIVNLTEAYNKAAKGNGFLEEFVIDSPTLALIDRYGDLCDDLHTDLHECLGHGSGQLLTGVDPDALKAYGNTIEEARADLFGLYYMADEKLVELNLLPNIEAHRAHYYTYMMNGLLTQTVRIEFGDNIEEAHMRNRALIANWCYEQGEDAIAVVEREGKHYLQINDYKRLRSLFATLLREIQRIKSEGDFNAAKELVERYAVRINPVWHREILERYEHLHLAPYKGFINPVLTPVYGQHGEITDVKVDYTESYTDQMLRYGREYATLI